MSSDLKFKFGYYMDVGRKKVAAGRKTFAYSSDDETPLAIPRPFVPVKVASEGHGVNFTPFHAHRKVYSPYDP